MNFIKRTVLSNMESMGNVQLQIEQYALKSPPAFSAIVFYLFLQLIFLFMKSICILFWTKLIFVPKRSRCSHVLSNTATNRRDKFLKFV